MSNLSDRISLLISELGLKKTAFAERLHISQAFVSQLCSGIKSPSDRTITDICREFNVSETWLRTGEGEMFQPVSRNEELFTFALSAAKAPPDDVRAQLLSVMARLSTDDWAALARIARLFLEEAGAAPPSSPKDSETGPD